MRGIPDKLATREDVYNVAMTLPPADAVRFLTGLAEPERRRLKIGQEEYYLLKSRVMVARDLEMRQRDQRLALDLARENARIDVERARRDYRDAQQAAISASSALRYAQEKLKTVNGQIAAMEVTHG